VDLRDAPAEVPCDGWQIGAVAAVVVGTALVGVLGGLSPLGFDVSALLEQPVYLLILLALSAALGARFSRRATSGSRWRAGSAGLIFGALWSPVAIVVVLVAALVDAMGRGVLAESSLPMLAVELIYSMAIFSIYGAIFFIPLGLVWAATTRAVCWVFTRARRPVRGGPASTVGVVLALLMISAFGGAAQSLAYAPWQTSCLALAGGAPTDAAFSPAGDLLVVALRADTGGGGTILLLSWPSGRPVARWVGTADGSVTVDPDGRVYWSTSNFSGRGTGIVSAVPGSAPTLLAGPGISGLDDMTWTTGGLIGVTTDTRSIATVSLATSRSTLAVQPGFGEVEALWASSDGSIVATEKWAGSTVDLAGPSGSVSVPVKGGAQSFALSADGTTLILAADSGGIRFLDLPSGKSRRVLPGNQAFIALSGHGDIAWANDEPFGPAQLCTSTLARLGAG
jgi:hypothetical protein